MIVVSNLTVLIGLAKIRQAHLLQDIFHKIVIPDAVFREVVIQGGNRSGVEEIRNANWISVVPVQDQLEVALFMTTLERGEAETLALAKQLHADVILLDEGKARKAAVLEGFEVMGLLGLLLVAKHQGRISLIAPFIQELQQHRFRLSQRIIEQILKEAGEEEGETWTRKINLKI